MKKEETERPPKNIHQGVIENRDKIMRHAAAHCDHRRDPDVWVKPPYNDGEE